VPGENIRICGEDARTGDTLVDAGTCMGPLEIGVAASAGFSSVQILRKLRVAIFTTGFELRQPGEKISLGEIYDSNRKITIIPISLFPSYRASNSDRQTCEQFTRDLKRRFPMLQVKVFDAATKQTEMIELAAA